MVFIVTAIRVNNHIKCGNEFGIQNDWKNKYLSAWAIIDTGAYNRYRRTKRHQSRHGCRKKILSQPPIIQVKLFFQSQTIFWIHHFCFTPDVAAQRNLPVIVGRRHCVRGIWYLSAQEIKPATYSVTSSQIQLQIHSLWFRFTGHRDGYNNLGQGIHLFLVNVH